MQRFSLLLLILLVISCDNFLIVEEVSHKNNIDSQEAAYTHGSFNSIQRGKVDFNVYLPPNWSPDQTYPLVLLLHGQGEDEYTFLKGIPADSLNHWITEKALPPMVLVALRGGKNTNEMQWYTDANEAMITSTELGELRHFCKMNFSTSMKSSQMAVIGHSRGATGALNFATYFPDKFAAVFSSAFVSDYAVERLQIGVNKNIDALKNNQPLIKLIIGTADQYVQNNQRKGTPTISAFFTEKGIKHEVEVVPNASHRLAELWLPNACSYLKFCSQNWK